MVTIVYIPREFQELRKEVSNHPSLLSRLQELPPEVDVGDWIGCVAAYCEIMLDGAYSAEDMMKIAERCTERLRDRRTLIVSMFGGIIH